MSALGDIYRGRANVNFTSKWKAAAALSAILVLVSVGALLFRGLNLGIEFSGGQSWEVRSAELTTEDLRDAISPLGLGDARIQRIANDLFRVRAELDDASSESVGEVVRTLADAAGVSPDEVTTNVVGASWGGDVTRSAVRALIVFGIVVFLYIALRLEWKMAVGALVAVVHDIVITVGIYALFQFEVTAATVIAFLTILGYSLYDTLIVFDKVRENERRASTSSLFTYSGLVSHSLNQVIMRSINTTITSVIPVLAVLIIGRFVLGAVTLQEFAIALLVGLLVGTYSSLFVAAPLVAWLKEREPANIERREKLGDSADASIDSQKIATELASADRAREVREKARQSAGLSGDAHRVTGRSAPSGSGAKSSSGADAARPQPSGDIVARPRKRKKN